MNHNNSGLHCPKALGHQYHQSSHSMIVFTVAGQLKVGLKSRLQWREISRLFVCLRLFRFCTTLFTLYTWWELAGDSKRDTRVFPQHACLLSRTHPTNSRPSIASAAQGIDFDAVIIQQALEAIDEVGDLLKVKYSRRKIDAKEWKLRQLYKERTINLEKCILPDKQDITVVLSS